LFCQNASADVCKVLVGNKLDADDERAIDNYRGKSVCSLYELIINWLITFVFKTKQQN
jgi:hypothetical protein